MKNLTLYGSMVASEKYPITQSDNITKVVTTSNNVSTHSDNITLYSVADTARMSKGLNWYGIAIVITSQNNKRCIVWNE